MRRCLQVLNVALSLAIFLPGVAGASEMLVVIKEPMTLRFGTTGADFYGGTFHEILIDGVYQETPWFSGFSGEIEFEAGALSSLMVDDSNPDRVTSSYEFGAGMLTLTAHWLDPIGRPVEGHYVAPLLGLTVDIRCEQELSESSCGDPFGDSLGDAFAFFGPGLFDHAFARALGVARAGGAFSFDFAMDGVTGNPADARRLGGSASGREDMVIPVAVPEPSIISLLLLASTAAWRCRRRAS